MRARRRRFRALWIAAALGLSAAPAGADSLTRECSAVNRNSASSCALERDAASHWSLTTRLLVGGGGKQDVIDLERHFCRKARERGVAAEVTRWNAIGSTSGNGAKMAWRCGAPPVAAGPPRHAR